MTERKTIAEQKEIIDNMLTALNSLNNAISDVNYVWEELDCLPNNDAWLVKDYPFNISFQEIANSSWIDTCYETLKTYKANLKERQLEDIEKRIKQIADVSCKDTRDDIWVEEFKSLIVAHHELVDMTQDENKLSELAFHIDSLASCFVTEMSANNDIDGDHYFIQVIINGITYDLPLSPAVWDALMTIKDHW